MTGRDKQFDDYVLKIHAALDRLDYYRILGVAKNASRAQVKKAFYGIAKRFHPDRNRDADEKTQAALYDIYKRLNEAYGVLLSPERRKVYDENLSQGKVRLEQDIRQATFSRKPEDTIKSQQARQFYLQAKAALEKGDLMQADLHIKVAMSKEPDHAVIQALIAEIQAAKAARKKQAE